MRIQNQYQKTKIANLEISLLTKTNHNQSLKKNVEDVTKDYKILEKKFSDLEKAQKNTENLTEDYRLLEKKFLDLEKAQKNVENLTEDYQLLEMKFSALES